MSSNKKSNHISQQWEFSVNFSSKNLGAFYSSVIAVDWNLLFSAVECWITCLMLLGPTHKLMCHVADIEQAKGSVVQFPEIFRYWLGSAHLGVDAPKPASGKCFVKTMTFV